LTEISEILNNDSKPVIMGILNVTPDSFSDGGEYSDPEKAFARAVSMHEDGATIIDIGGESTRPGARPVEPDMEISRIIPVIKALRAYSRDMIISADTRRSEVAREALKAGADMINDISGSEYDKNMIPLIREAMPGYVVMHSSSEPSRMQLNPVGEMEIMPVIINFFRDKLRYLEKCGIVNNVIIDPGIGFGKTPRANLVILKHLSVLEIFKKPVLIGLSRKSFIGHLDKSDVKGRIGGSIAGAVFSFMNGADIIRSHDVSETVQALKVIKNIERC